jgi:hypothetical protein
MFNLKQCILTGATCLAWVASSFGQTPPPNDNFSNRIVLTGNMVTFSGTLAGATLEAQEALGGNLTNQVVYLPTKSVWWTWTATQSGYVTVQMLGSSLDTVAQSPNDIPVDSLAIYATTNVFALTQPVVEMRLDLAVLCEAFTFPATAGSSYQIQLLGSSSAAYEFNLIATNVPVILREPRSVTVSSNASTLFTVVAEGLRPLSYQWQFAGTNIPGQTAPMLPLTNIQGNQAGNFTVVVSNSVGVVTSAPAALAVSTNDVHPAISPLNSQTGNFTFQLTGEIGRNYRIQSSLDLNIWTNEVSFAEPPIFPSPLSSVVFNTNGLSLFTISNNTVRKFVRALRYQPANEICINNLREIRFAKLLWTRERTQPYRLSVPVPPDIAPYFPGGVLPHCPEDTNELFVTSYPDNTVVTEPQCYIDPSHVLEDPQ